MIGLLVILATAPLDVRVIGEPCAAVIDGSATSEDKLEDAFSKIKNRHRKAVVHYDIEATYRCIGAVIYYIQRAGIRRIEFDPPFPTAPVKR